MKSFSKEHTLLVKGVAICIMFFHHLFYRQEFTNMYYWTISIRSHPVIQFLATHAKICVAIFVFLSAYGLTISYRNTEKQMEDSKKKWKDNFKYLYHRIKKLYLLYWPIFIVCIIIGWITKCRIPMEVYKSLGEAIRDFFGIAYIIDGESPFVGAWWYISFSLLLYVFFSILYRAVKKYPKAMLGLSFILGIKNFTEIPILIEVQRYFFVSCLGIYFANGKIFEKIFELFTSWKLIAISMLSCVIFFIIRCIHAFTFDGFLVVSIIVLTIALLDNTKYIKKSLQILGKNSGNMFLIHGIIYLYWLKDFLYGFKYPIVIFMMLLGITLLFSVGIEYGKTIICKMTEYFAKNNMDKTKA